MSKLANRFVLERELGAGGMARVFLGRDEVLDRPVAVKVLNAVHSGTDTGGRFQREGRTAARLAHPNIVQVYDAGQGELDGRESPYIVMEYVSGGDLKELIDRRGRLSGAELCRLGGEVCSGLAHAHERGVIHRDIKPHNILLDENGHAKLTDFGIARALDTSQATLTGAYLGTALYSSPEQLQGQKVTPKSDVYSLGATLYQAAVGEAPFTGGTPIEVASQHVSKAPTPPRERGAEIGEDLETLILDCLAKDPDDRPTAEEARSRLEAAVPVAGAARARTQAPAAAPPRTEQTRAERTRSTPAAPAAGGRAARPAGGDRGGRRRGALAVVALLAVLAVVGALAVPSLLGGNGEQGGAGQNDAQNDAGQNDAQQNAQGAANAGEADDANGNAGGEEGQNGGGQGSGGGDEQQAPSGNPSATASASAPQEPSEDAGQEGSGGDPGGSGEEPAGGQGDSEEEAAAQAIQSVYEEAAAGDYGASYDLLSEGFKTNEAPTQETWASTFDELESVRFVEGPNAEVSGNTATVTGVTIAENAGQTERNTVTWRMVNEGGQWKMDAITSFEQEIVSG